MDSPSPVPSPDPEDAHRKLQAVTDAALAHLALDDLLDELLARIRDALDADTCAMLLLDPETNELVARAAKGLEEEVEQGVRIPFGAGFAGRVAASRKPIAIDDLEQADLRNPILRERGIKSLLGAPLIAEGRVLGVVHVGTFRTHRFSRQEIELIEIVAQRAALAVDRALVYDEVIRLGELQREFIALAAHELRSPVASIYGLAATLRERRELSPATVGELQTTLYQQADRMRRLVEQLLDLSRLEAAAVEVKRERTRLRPYVEEVVASVASERQADVRVDVPEELEAVFDRAAVERVLVNVIANALSYGEVPVIVSARHADRHLRLAVEDRGPGVPPEFVSQLFDRFRRGEGARATRSGVGLGLAIARSYARAQGGDLFYAPAEPRGARFELVLPVNAVND